MHSKRQTDTVSATLAVDPTLQVRAADAICAHLGPNTMGWLHIDPSESNGKRGDMTKRSLAPDDLMRSWSGETDDVMVMLSEPRTVVIDCDVPPGSDGFSSNNVAALAVRDVLVAAKYEGAAICWRTPRGIQAMVPNREPGDVHRLREQHGVKFEWGKVEILERMRLPAQGGRAGAAVRVGRDPVLLDIPSLFKALGKLRPYDEQPKMPVYEARSHVEDVQGGTAGGDSLVFSTLSGQASTRVGRRNLLLQVARASPGSTFATVELWRDYAFARRWPLHAMRVAVSDAVHADPRPWQRVRCERRRGAPFWAARYASYGYPELGAAEMATRPAAVYVGRIREFLSQLGGAEAETRTDGAYDALSDALAGVFGPRVLANYLDHACAHIARMALQKSFEWSLGWACIAETMEIPEGDRRRYRGWSGFRHTRAILDAIIGHFGLAALAPNVTAPVAGSIEISGNEAAVEAQETG